MYVPPSLAFFAPAYNEADNLTSLVARIHEYCDDARVPNRTVIIVDDGSKDHTPQVVSQLQEDYGITVVSHSVNQGYGAALRSGLRAAVETQADWIAFCDADGQFDPMDMHRLFGIAYKTGADVAIGYRENRADNRKRRVLGRVWHALSSSILGYKARDVDCGFKLFSRKSLMAIESQLCGEHATISPEILTRLQLSGFLIVETPIPHFPRTHGEQTGANFHVMWNSLVGLLKVRQLVRKETYREYTPVA